MSVAEDERSVAGDGGEEGDDLYMEIQVESLNDLEIGRHLVQGVQDSWRAFLDNSESDQAAGEAIYSALFEGAPSLQPLFITPRAVQSVRFLNGIKNFVHVINNPTQLKVAVETLGFGHLNIEVTIPRVMIFRDALIDLLEGDLGDDFGPAAREGWMTLLSYIGGALIYVRTNYAERLRILADSWKAANRKDVPVKVVEERKKKKEKKAVKEENGTANGIEQNGADPLAGLDLDGLSNSDASSQSGSEGNFILNEAQKQTRPSMMSRLKTSVFGQNGSAQASGGDNKDSGKKHDTNSKFKMHMGGADVPRTFEEMFQWNCAVMGLAGRTWMKEVLVVFDAIVTNVSDSTRLQQECSVLAIKIGKCGWTGPVNLTEYKSCMLAALRSLLPKVWDSNYEVAWNWLWDNVEILLKKNMGQPLIWEKSLQKCLTETLDVATQYEFRKDCYERFFTAAPGGQDYFKQSNTRLHFIAERITWMTLELLQEPWKMVDDISALGLRHVGFGIPTDLFGPLATAYIEVFGRYVADDLAVEAYRWSIGLISQMLVQTITEGSTIVMKAINVNSSRQLQKAVSCAPRGVRASWVLLVQVGSQSISPLGWSIESGSLNAAKAMLEDLLAIRADRERYYYGLEELFARHPDIVHMLCADAPSLVPTFLEGLVWRSRRTENGSRRVNYYVKPLLINIEGKFADALSDFVMLADPKIISQPVLDLCSNTLWNGIVRNEFIVSKIWFIISLFALMMGQAILTEWPSDYNIRCACLAFRIFTYLLTMCRLMLSHIRDIWLGYYRGDIAYFYGLPVPRYIKDIENFGGLVLGVMLICMCIYEPFFNCIGAADWPVETCENSHSSLFKYSVFAMCAVGIHWCLMVDLSVFSTGLSAFVLVCAQVGSEIGRFMAALLFLLLLFASSISVLEHDYPDMRDVSMTVVALFSITVKLYEDDYRDFQDDPILLCMVFAFVTASAILLLNLLIAQLNCSYVYIYANMVGFARLKRAEVIVEELKLTKPAKWTRFVGTLGLDFALELNEGDVGMAGGIQGNELQSAHVVTQDRILRYGGSCAQDMQWPEDGMDKEDEDEDKLQKMERIMKAALAKISGSERKKKKHKSGGSGIGNSGVSGSSGSSGGSEHSGETEDSDNKNASSVL